MKKNATLLGALLGVVIGCGASIALPSEQARAQAASPAAGAQTFNGFCERYRGSSSHNELNVAIKRYGDEGFSLVSLSMDQSKSIAACFETPR